MGEVQPAELRGRENGFLLGINDAVESTAALGSRLDPD
jgi:hypothetical protein